MTNANYRVRHNLSDDCMGSKFPIAIQSNYPATDTIQITYVSTEIDLNWLANNYTVAVFRLKEKTIA